MDLSPTQFSGRKGIRAPFLALVAVTLLVYSVSFFNGFVSDDEVLIVNNPETLSLRNISDVMLAPDVVKPYYRPLNRATYLLDYWLAGMNPAWYHGVNVVIHLGNVLLLFLVSRRILCDGSAAFVAALAFGIHPVNCEAVNFISARNNLLALFFSLASLLAFMGAREKRKRIPVLSALLFFFGLLSKETAFMLIVMIALCTFVPLMDTGEDMKEPGRLLFLLPFLLSASLYFVLRSYSLGEAAGTHIPYDGLFQRFAANYHVIPRYLGLLLFPADLTMYHKLPGGGVLQPFWILPAWILFLAGVVLALRGRNRPVIFGLVWLVINYAPISNIVPIPSAKIAERYLYIPAIGFFIGLGSLFSWIRSKEGWNNVLLGVTAIVVLALSVLTIQRNLEWKDDLSLSLSGVRNDPGSTGALYNLGTAYRDRGDLVSAKQAWERVLAIEPNYADALTQLGTLAAFQGDLARAERYYHAALQAPPGVSDPDKSMAHYNLGKIYEKRQLPSMALDHYRHFLATVPFTYIEYRGEVERRIAALLATSPPETTR